MIFIDGAPGEIRGDLVCAVRGLATYVIAHDTEGDVTVNPGNYGWRKTHGIYTHEVIWKEVTPWTTVYSDAEAFVL